MLEVTQTVRMKFRLNPICLSLVLVDFPMLHGVLLDSSYLGPGGRNYTYSHLMYKKTKAPKV